MAALAAGYLLNRIRRPEPEPLGPRIQSESEGQVSLEKLRAAGF